MFKLVKAHLQGLKMMMVCMIKDGDGGGDGDDSCDCDMIHLFSVATKRDVVLHQGRMRNLRLMNNNLWSDGSKTIWDALSLMRALSSGSCHAYM